MGHPKHPGQHLAAAECAEEFGVTVRALRVYERHGLLAPQRTVKNWRVYGPADIERLKEILLLKQLGLSLSQITRLLAGRSASLAATLATQRGMMRALRERADSSLKLIAAAEAKLAEGDTVSVSDLISLVKEITMTQQSTQSEAAWKFYEQARPRTEITLPATELDALTGHYQLSPQLIFDIRRDGNQLFARLGGQPEAAIYPEAKDHFFYKVVPAQLSFQRGDDGLVTGLTLHQNGIDQDAPRIDAQAAAKARGSLEDRIRSKQPVPGSRAILDRLISSARTGEVDDGFLSAELEALAIQSKDYFAAEMSRLGQIEAIDFAGVSTDGWDVYHARFANGEMEWRFVLGDHSEVTGVISRPIP